MVDSRRCILYYNNGKFFCKAGIHKVPVFFIGKQKGRHNKHLKQHLQYG